MYTLYYSPGACSMAVHAVLNEMNQPVTLVKAKSADGQKTSEFLQANPRGQVPTLVEDGFVMREGGAILVYLMDKHQSPLLPKSGKERAAALEWLMFANASLHPAYSKAFGSGSYEDKDVAAAVFKAAIEQINKLWKDIDGHLAKNKYLGGNQIGAADILVTVIANWGQAWGQKAVLGENVKRLIKEVIARPSYQKALKDEQVEYKAAA